MYQFKFFGKTTTNSLLYELAKKFDVESNVVFANVTELQGTTLGIFTVAFFGEDTEIDRVYQYVKEKDIPVQEVRL